MSHKQKETNIKIKIDYRQLTKQAQEKVRIDSVKRVIRYKESPEKVAAEYGYSRVNIYLWIKIYRQKGYYGLKAKKATGGQDRKLSQQEIARLKRYLGKDPRQLKFHFGLWTIEMVKQLVKDKFGKTYVTSGMHKLLKSLGYSYQKPILKPIEQNPQAVQTFLKEEYPKIKLEAKEQGREIYFCDESGFQSIHNKVKTWGKIGERPIVTHTGRRFSKGVISAITPTGKIRFMQYDGSMDADKFIIFLKRIQANEARYITLILDGLPVHKSKKVKKYVESTKGKIKIYILPGYSPNLNPDELVWSAAKRNVQGKLVKTKHELEHAISSFLHGIQKKRGYIQQLFRHPSVEYVG